MPVGPEIGLGVVSELLDDLGSHPEGRSDDGVPLGHGVCQLAGDAEIRELGVPGVVEKDVAGLDVAVDLASRVQIGETVQGVSKDSRDLRLSEGGLAESHEVRDGSPAAVLHDDPEVGVVEVGAVVADDEGGAALLHDADLLDDVLQIRVHRHLLDRHHHAALLLHRLVHCAVAALPQLSHHLEHLLRLLRQQSRLQAPFRGHRL